MAELVERIPLRPVKWLQSRTFDEFMKDCELEIGRRKLTKKDMKDKYKLLHSFCGSLIKSRGIMQRIYKYSLSTPLEMGGRLFCGGSIQGLAREYRSLLLRDMTTDIDMKNAHPVILRYICKKHGIPCPQLEYYINHRDDILANWTSKSLGKTAYLENTNNEKYSTAKGQSPEENKGLRLYATENKIIQKQLIALPEYAQIVNSIPNEKTWNRNGSALNRILCYYENKIIGHCVHVLNIRNIEICVYMFDGLMVYGDFYQNIGLLTEIENYVESKMEGLNMKWDYKQHDTVHTVPEEFDESKVPVEKDGVEDDAGARDVILKHYPHWKNCQNAFYIFDDDTGLWTTNKSVMTGKISELANHLWVIVKDKDGNYKKTKNYARNECLRRNIWGFIMEVTIDDDWLRQNEHSCMGKLLFPNGVLNLRTGVFYSKDKYPFDPEIVFTYRMPQDFIYDTIDDDYMEDIRKRLFVDLLGEEVGNYQILQFARALAGDLAKQITFGIGLGNNGKSVQADAIKHAIGDYFGSFDAEDFVHNPGSSRDGAQKMRPFYLNRNKRILISNELGSGSVVSGDMVKKNCSGGDTLKGRLHGGNETEFVPQYMVFMFSNEFPRFYKIDEPTYERARVVDYIKKIVDNPIEEDEIQKDSNIVNEIKEERFRAHLVALLCSEYFRFVENKIKEVIPQAVLIARNEWIGNSGEFNIVGKFLETFELTNNKEDYLTSESIKYWLSDQFRGTSMEKFGKQLKNYIKKKFGLACAIENKPKKLNGKITQVWIGIRRIPEEEEKPSTGNNPPLDASSDVTTVLVEV